MERTGAQPMFWFLALSLVCFCLNHSIDPSLPGNRSPLMMITGHYFDISPILSFRFNEPIYFLREDPSFPSETREGRGLWMGIAENVGTDLCYKIYDQASGKMIERSAVRSALTPELRNLSEDPILVTEVPPSASSDRLDSPPMAVSSKNGELSLSSKPFPAGTKVTKLADGVAVPGVIENFDSDSQLYLLIYSDGSTESLSHWRIDKECSPSICDVLCRAKTDGEMAQRASCLDAFEKCRVVLRDANGKPRVDENGEPITVIGQHPDDLESKTFLTHPDKHGKIRRARIGKALNKHEAERLKDPTLIKYFSHSS